MRFALDPFANTLISVGLAVQVLSAIAFALATDCRQRHEALVAAAVVILCFGATGGLLLDGNYFGATGFIVFLIAEAALIFGFPVFAGSVSVLSGKSFRALQYVFGLLAITAAIATLYGIGVGFTGRR